MSIFHITDTPDWGQLKINLTSRIHAHPIENARISISYTGVPDETLEELTTDSSGQTDTINLPAPPIEYSLDEQTNCSPILNIQFLWKQQAMNLSRLQVLRFYPQSQLSRIFPCVRSFLTQIKILFM